MLIRADITCLNCGRFLGELEGERHHSYKAARMIVPSGRREVIREPSGLRCGYCGGKAIAEAVDTIRSAA